VLCVNDVADKDDDKDDVVVVSERARRVTFRNIMMLGIRVGDK
jgi:hypothetical protein